MIKSSGNGSGRTSIHIALQGKGGVGKSLISAISVAVSVFERPGCAWH